MVILCGDYKLVAEKQLNWTCLGYPNDGIYMDSNDEEPGFRLEYLGG